MIITNVCEMLPINIRFLRWGPHYEVSIKTNNNIIFAIGNTLAEALLKLASQLQQQENDPKLIPLPDWFEAWESLVQQGIVP